MNQEITPTGSGHTVHIEKPKQFFGMIRAFTAAKSLDFEYSP